MWGDTYLKMWLVPVLFNLFHCRCHAKFSNIFSNTQYKLDISVTLCHILIFFVTRRVCHAGTRLYNVLLSNIEVLSHDIKEFKSTWMDIP